MSDDAARANAKAAFDATASKRCTGCTGRGTVPSREVKIRDDGTVIMMPWRPYPCPLCHGTGIEPCDHCNGGRLTNGAMCPHCVPPRDRWR